MFIVCLGLVAVGNHTVHLFSRWTFHVLWLGPWVLSIESSLFSWKEVVCGLVSVFVAWK